MVADKEMCDLNELNNMYMQALNKLKERKGKFAHKSKEVHNYKEKRDELEKELDDISRFR